jgi:hypothetical protein
MPAARPPVPKMVKQRYEPFVPLGELTPHPANPNQGDQGLLGQLLEENGFGGAVLAQESTGIIIDGETRWRAADDEGLEGVPVIFMDVTDDERDRFLASWNESGRRGLNDESKLVALLKGLAVTPRGLAGAAFDGDDLDSMIHRLQAAGKFDASGEWKGMPRFDNPGRESAYTCSVHFRSHEDAARFFTMIERPLTRILWWPEHDGHVGSVPDADEIAGEQDPDFAADNPDLEDAR